MKLPGDAGSEPSEADNDEKIIYQEFRGKRLEMTVVEALMLAGNLIATVEAYERSRGFEES